MQDTRRSRTRPRTCRWRTGGTRWSRWRARARAGTRTAATRRRVAYWRPHMCSCRRPYCPRARSSLERRVCSRLCWSFRRSYPPGTACTGHQCFRDRSLVRRHTLRIQRRVFRFRLHSNTASVLCLPSVRSCPVGMPCTRRSRAPGCRFRSDTACSCWYRWRARALEDIHTDRQHHVYARTYQQDIHTRRRWHSGCATCQKRTRTLERRGRTP